MCLIIIGSNMVHKLLDRHILHFTFTCRSTCVIHHFDDNRFHHPKLWVRRWQDRPIHTHPGKVRREYVAASLTAFNTLVFLASLFWSAEDLRAYGCLCSNKCACTILHHKTNMFGNIKSRKFCKVLNYSHMQLKTNKKQKNNGLIVCKVPPWPEHNSSI